MADRNVRGGAWFFSIADTNGNPLLCGRKVLVTFPMLSRFLDPTLPPGELFAVDTSGLDQEPGQTDLGGRVQLYYIDAAAMQGSRIARALAALGL